MVNVVQSHIDEPATAEVYDDILRWKIPSRSEANVDHLVELNAPPGYDVCDCIHFQTKLGPLLRRGISPETALADGLVKLKKGERVEDVLKCFHIKEAEYRFAMACKRVMTKMRREADKSAKQNHATYAATPHAPQENRQPETYTPPPRFQATGR